MRRLLPVAIGLAMLGGLWWLVPAQLPSSLPVTRSPTMAPEPDATAAEMPTVEDPRETAGDEPTRKSQADGGPRPDTAISFPHLQRSPERAQVDRPDSDQSIIEEVWQLRRDAELWRMEDYLALRAEPPLEPEAFYTAYEFLVSCEGRPRSAAEFEAQIGRFQRRHEREPERFGADQLAEALDFLEQGFDRCEGLDEDLQIAAYEALETAADMGFVPAQLEYLRRAGRLLIRDDAWLFANPEYVLRYRGRAEAFGTLALQLDEPEGYLAYAQFVFSGFLGPEDPVTAYALAELAAREAHPARAEAESAQRGFGERLDQEQIEAALELAGEFCDRYCRKAR